MRRLLAAVLASGALTTASPAAAQPFTDVTPADTGIVLCPADLGGGGAALVWQRFGETSAGRETLDLATAGLDPVTPPKALVVLGGCPKVATAATGASLIALNYTGLAEGEGQVIVLDRASNGATSTPLALSADEHAEDVVAAVASSGAALVAWEEPQLPQPELADAGPVMAVRVAARDAGGAFVPAGTLGAESRNVTVGIDEAGYGIVVWSETVPSAGTASRLLAVTRAPGGAFSAPHEIGRAEAGEADALSLVVGRTGEALLAVSDSSGVRVGGGTTRTGIGALKQLDAGTTGDVTTTLSASGAAAVAWRQLADEHAPRSGVAVSVRPPGGNFGAPRGLAAPGTRLGGNETTNLRLAAAPDGRMIASWAVEVSSGDRSTSPIPVAALRRADGTWEAAVPLAGPCRQQIDAFPGFGAAGRPRVTFVDTGLVSGGDYAFPIDTRIRVARLDAAPAAPVAPPKITLGGTRKQVLRRDKLKLRVRCARTCDARMFAVIGRHSSPASGLFPHWRRLRAGRWYDVVLDTRATTTTRRRSSARVAR